MEESIDHRPSKRLKITREQNRCSTFECLSGELILELFEYFNTKEISQSFFNLTSLITSCIFDQRRQLHLYLDRQMPFLLEDYFLNQIISLRIEHITTQITTFPNLKSLSIVYGNEREEECLNMVKQIWKLSQLINFELSLVGSQLTTTGHKMIETSLYHPSLRRIILLKRENSRLCTFYRHSPVKLAFPSTKLVYVSDDFHGRQIHQLCYKVGNSVPIHIKPQYHVRCLDLDCNDWRIEFLVTLLSSLPLLVTLKVKGCGQSFGWLCINIWDQMLQNLMALQRVDIDICIAIRIGLMQMWVKSFNEIAAQKVHTCKRINLSVGPRTKQPGLGGLQFNASLNMN